MVSIMNKNLKHIIMATEYVEMKKKGLEYIRGISSIAEQISEIDVELTAMKAIKNSDPIRKAQLKDWINTLKTERKKILQQEKKNNKALSNLHELFDENVQLKEQVKKIRKEKQETIAKIKKAKIQQALKFDRKRVELIEKLKTKQKQLDATLKTNPRTIAMKELRERKTFGKLVRKQAYNHDHLEYESVKTARLQKKAEGSRVRSHEVYLYSGDSNEKHDNIKADVHVILHSMIQTRDTIQSRKNSTD